MQGISGWPLSGCFSHRDIDNNCLVICFNFQLFFFCCFVVDNNEFAVCLWLEGCWHAMGFIFFWADKAATRPCLHFLAWDWQKWIWAKLNNCINSVCTTYKHTDRQPLLQNSRTKFSIKITLPYLPEDANFYPDMFGNPGNSSSMCYGLWVMCYGLWVMGM